MKDKKVLIFGVSGFVGPYLAQEFMNNGYMVIGSDILQKSLPDYVQFERCDFTNYQSVYDLISRVTPDIIINLGAISSVGKSWSIPQQTITINVNGALNIMEAARQMDKKPKILLIGSSEEYSEVEGKISETALLNANNPYGISKIAQEQFSKIYRDRYGLKVYNVRAFNHTGLGQADSFVLSSFCKQVAEIEKTNKTGEIYVGNLNVKRDFSDVRDIVRAYRLVVESNNYNDIYNIGSGKAYNLKDLLNYIITLAHVKIEVKIDQRRYRPVDTYSICSNCEKIKNDLGWEPKYNIYETLEQMYNEYLNKG